MPNQKRNNLRTQFILVFVVAITCLLSFSLIFTWQNFVVQKEQVIDLQREIAQDAANDIRILTHALVSRLRIVARITNLINLPQEEQQSVLSQLRSYKDMKQRKCRGFCISYTMMIGIHCRKL